MKRPFSPSALSHTELDRRGFGSGLGVQMDGEHCCDTHNECALPEEQSPGGAVPTALYRPKRERKRRSYTLCEVCNIQLNSAAQAQIHYNGKSHQKRLKQISNGKMPSNTGETFGKDRNRVVTVKEKSPNQRKDFHVL
ncbi:Zinc finger protein 385B Zinc finger protein 533 [Channa argus]|uniref:Zinc finger protein 385B Zinc finger protein 533 n=1 Tax=Channa argus TaxID=215402 RepID=A0A6G1QC67_CHAAH|nr:Zinc finger protein 385B Zinc finger protein 533 [Channa argus]